MFDNGKKSVRSLTVQNVLFIISFTIGLVLLVVNFDVVVGLLRTITTIVKPFVIGIGLAYVFNIPYKMVYKKMPMKKEDTRRKVALVLTLLLFVVIISLIIMILVPQITENITTIVNDLPTLQKDLMETISDVLEKLKANDSVIDTVDSYMSEIQTYIMNFLSNLLPTVLATTMNITSFLMNSLLAIVTAIYVTLSKEKMLRQAKKIMYAFLPTKKIEKVSAAASIANKTFSSFIGGQIIEAFIIGMITYVVSLMSGMPFAPILGIVIGVTNVIPYFGPIIGTFLCAFLILFIDPFKAGLFVVQGIIIQQIESNLIYPRVVGSSVGLSGVWVLVAITVGGGLFGIPGMVLGLPTFATIYFLFSDYVKERFRKRFKKEQDIGDSRIVEDMENIMKEELLIENEYLQKKAAKKATKKTKKKEE